MDDHEDLLFTDLALFNRKLADWLVFDNASASAPHLRPAVPAVLSSCNINLSAKGTGLIQCGGPGRLGSLHMAAGGKPTPRDAAQQLHDQNRALKRQAGFVCHGVTLPAATDATDLQAAMAGGSGTQARHDSSADSAWAADRLPRAHRSAAATWCANRSAGSENRREKGERACGSPLIDQGSISRIGGVESDPQEDEAPVLFLSHFGALEPTERPVDAQVQIGRVAIAHGPVAGFEGIVVHGATVSNSNPTTRRVSRLNSMPTK